MWRKLGFRSDTSNTDLDTANMISDNRYRQIRDRIRHCLDDDYDSNDVDQTLNLMRDETERWTNIETSLDNNDQLPISEYEYEKIDKTSSPTNDELLGYCLRLERNNAYLTQLIDKFEQVSFKKRYSELLITNKKLENEYDRLKSTNSKVYSSYCDLLEENKRLKKTNKELSTKLARNDKESESANSEVEEIVSQLEKLKKENESNKKLLKDYRNSKMKLQKDLTEKENEVIKLKGENIATKLKLERIEKLVFKEKASNVSHEANANENEIANVNVNVNNEPTIPDDLVEEDDTIALLQAKYKTKVTV
ncbi:hypothetical protein CANINC_004801 [Pichia inconspicua]|uniref:Uncharacterized protein n=1 Tax=Pichia inconspicua TaxID=52247 RepID=A0A4T0WVE4_9ASCO|nr:hypothetical protein CANINC_004801 [[Candida] inconspicua]